MKSSFTLELNFQKIKFQKKTMSPFGWRCGKLGGEKIVGG